MKPTATETHLTADFAYFRWHGHGKDIWLPEEKELYKQFEKSQRQEIGSKRDHW